MPHIILIVLDTVGAEGAGIEEGTNMPYLSSIAARAYYFSHCSAPSDRTDISHYSLFSGMTAKREDNEMFSEMDRPEFSIMGVLKECGYHTYGISANPVVLRIRTVRAFDAYQDIWRDVEMTYRRDTDTERINQYNSQILPVFQRYKMIAEGDDQPLDQMSDALSFCRSHILACAESVNSAVMQTVDDHVQNCPTVPFFLFVNYLDAHDPYLPDADYYNLSEEKNKVYPNFRYRPLPPDQEEKMVNDSFVKGKGLEPYQYCQDLSSLQIETYRKRHLAEIRELDDHLMELFKFFEQRNLYENSIFIIVADHGESFGEENTMTHSLGEMSHLQSTHHVPLIIVPEQKGKKPTAVDRKVHLADIVPTFYYLLGIDKAYPYDGESFAETFSKSDFRDYQKYNLKDIVGETKALAIDAREDAERRIQHQQTLKSLGYIN